LAGCQQKITINGNIICNDSKAPCIEHNSNGEMIINGSIINQNYCETTKEKITGGTGGILTIEGNIIGGGKNEKTNE